MKIIAFGASYSRASINKEFAAFAATQFGTHEVEVLDLNDYSLPLFTVDVEKELGQPQAAKDFVAKMEEADALIISVTEHNGNFSAAFKNLFDWASRVKLNMFEGKRMLLLSTSPGQGGGAICPGNSKRSVSSPWRHCSGSFLAAQVRRELCERARNYA
jgi:chromate reductase